MRPHRPRGFSLLELAVVLAIVGFLAALSVAALRGVKNRATFSNVAAEAAQGVRRARAEAFGRGVATAFVVDTVGRRWWVLEAPSGTLDLDTFDPTAPGTVITSGTFPQGITFGPSGGYGQALDAPLAGVPVTSAQSPALPYCSFCRATGTNQGFGAVVFEAGGRATFTSLPATSALRSAVGHQFTLTGTQEGAARTMLVAVVGRTGLVKSFER